MTTEKEFNRFSIALNDFEKAAGYAKEALKFSESSLAHEALVFAAIVCYYRPFSQNEKDKLSPAACQLQVHEFNLFSAEEHEIHECCKNLRNKALAHSEWTYNPTRLNPNSGVIFIRPFVLLSHAPALPKFIQLSERLANECHHKRANYVR